MRNIWNNILDILLYLLMVVLIVIVGFFTFSKLFAKNKITASALQLPSENTVTLTEKMASLDKETSTVIDNWLLAYRVTFTNHTGGENPALVNITPYTSEYLYGVFKYIGEGEEQDISSFSLRVMGIYIHRYGSSKQYSNKIIHLSSVKYLSDTIVNFTPVIYYESSLFDGLSNLREFQFSLTVTPASIVNYLVENYTFEFYVSKYDFAGIVNYNYQMGYNKGYQSGLSAGSNADVEQAYQEGYNAGYQAGINYASGVFYNNGYNSGYSKGYAEGYQSGLNAGNLVAYEEGYQEGYNAGVDAGYSEGYTEGDADGYDRGASEGYNSGYDEGYSDGYNSGYDFGFVEGQNTDMTSTSFLGGIIGGVVGILNLNILPGFTLGMLITIPLILGLFFWLFKLIGGGN